ncbi:MAG TPA: hypothetical protein PK379_07725 [Candidatus Hydrogenedentes bacterium]|nr:hypothetical protein [Candidatus Hydrogenedentota bacterium]HOK89901.1 hypothetical protein [Candidatus Hydrogenedentota bacterium]
MNLTDLLPAALPDWCGTETEPANWIEISTVCSLFRNLPDLPFPPAARQEERLEVTRRVEDAVQLLAPLGDTLGFTEKELESPVGALLAERHLAARELLHGHGPRAIFTDRGGTRAVMVNALDHVTIRALAPGNDPGRALRQVLAIEETLGSALDFAYDDTRGFLTTRLTCTGTGLKVCAILHLPALSLIGMPHAEAATVRNREVVLCGAATGSGLDLALPATAQGDPQQLMAIPYIPVESISGQCLLTEVEGIIPAPLDQSVGALYAVISQHSLGLSEEEIAYRVQRAVQEWRNQEEETRLTLLKSNSLWLQDWVGRAVALARGTHLAGFGEALDWLSRIRLGAALGILRAPGLTPAVANRALIEIQAAHLAPRAGQTPLSRLELARLRAEKLREFLARCEAGTS